MGAFITALAAVGCFAGTGWLWFQRLQRVEVPEDRTFFISAWLLGFVIGVLALTQDPGFISGLLATVATLGSAAVLGLIVLAPQRADAAIAVGDTIPEFTAYDDQGDSFDSIQLHNKKLLIKFFHGQW